MLQSSCCQLLEDGFVNSNDFTALRFNCGQVLLVSEVMRVPLLDFKIHQTSSLGLEKGAWLGVLETV